MSSHAPSLSGRGRIVLSLVGIVAMLAMGFIGAAVLAKLKEPPPRSDEAVSARAVGVTAVSNGSHRETVAGFGRARALRRSTPSAEVAGVVTWLAPALESGEWVDEDEVLVRLDDADFARALRQSEAMRARNAEAVEAARERAESFDARLASVATEREAAERELDRIEGLAERDLSARNGVDLQVQIVERLRQGELEMQWQKSDAQRALAQARATLEESEVAVERAEADVARCEIQTPYAGAIVARMVQLGNRVNVGESLFELVDTKLVEVPLALAASHVHDVAVGSRVTLRRRADDPSPWQGAVARVDPTIREEDRTFLVYVLLEGGDARAVPPGSFLTAEVEGRAWDEVIVLPRAAFVGESVFVVSAEEDGTLARRRTPNVVRWLPEVALVRGGLDSGEQVLITHLEEIADGTRIDVHMATWGQDEATAMSTGPGS